MSFNRQKYLGLHSNNSRELATVDPDQFADRYDAAVETEILLRQAIHEDETFVAQQERMINGLDSRLQAAKRLASQLTFRR